MDESQLVQESAGVLPALEGSRNDPQSPKCQSPDTELKAESGSSIAARSIEMSLLPRDRWPVVSEPGQRLMVFAWKVVATVRTGALLSNICGLLPEGGKSGWDLDS